MKIIRKLSRLTAAFSLLALLVGMTAPAALAEGAAGTQITNTARADFTRGGSPQALNSNSVVTTVALASEVVVTPTAASADASPATPTYIAYSITNSGNGADSFNLSLSVSPSWPARLLNDANGDGQHQSAETTQVASTGTLQAGANANVLVEVTPPSSVAADTTATATTTAASAANPSVRASASGTVTVRLNGRVVGRVKGRDGRGQRGARVAARPASPSGAPVLADADAAASPAATTGSDGSYSISGLPFGTYDIVVSGADIVPQQVAGMSLNATKPQAAVDFNVYRTPVLQAGANLVTIPFNFASPDLTAVVTVPAGVTVAAWKPEASGGRYVYLGRDADFPTVAPGTAFVVTQSGSGPVQFKQCPAAASPTSVALKAGWNLVGGTDVSTISLANLGIRSGGLTYTLAEAAKRNLTLGYGWGYDPRAGDYVLAHPTYPGAQRALEAWKGYWVKAYADCELVQVTAAASASQAAPEMKWAAQLAATCGRVSDRFNYLGVASDATGAAAYYRLESPPLGSASALDLSFTPNPAPATPERYATDIRPEASGKIAWDFTVKSTTPNATVVITWPDIRRVPSSYNLTLVDVESGRRRFMRTTSSYSYTTGPTGGERGFQVVADPATFARMSVSPLAQMPATTGVTLSYTLSQDAAVSAEVRTLSGALVRRLSSERAATAGTNLISWDGKDQSGARVVNGPYLVIISASNGDGQMLKQSRSVILLR